ncbi:MAG: PaaI family thioesterase [Rhodobacteraceae bacterium]|nr:PaaI family thioesterase [Paracoccaceae bacterium]
MNRSGTVNFKEQILHKHVFEGIPYLKLLGIRLDFANDELRVALPYSKQIIGNPDLPAIHGGVTASLLEITARVTLCLKILSAGPQYETKSTILSEQDLELPKTISFYVDYLRSGKPLDSFARAKIYRMGRRYASVQVEAWQDDRSRMFAQGTGHFLLI